MKVVLNDVCPCFDWVKASERQCTRCPHFGMFCKSNDGKDIVECKYSAIPIFESPFKVGDKVWYLDYGQFPTQEKVRTIIWRGSFYEYQCGRKQHSYKVYATKEECDRALALKNIHEAKSKIQEALKLVGGLENLKTMIEENKIKLIE